MSTSRGRVSPPGLAHTRNDGCGGSRRACQRRRDYSLCSWVPAHSFGCVLSLYWRFYPPVVGAYPVPLPLAGALRSALSFGLSFAGGDVLVSIFDYHCFDTHVARFHDIWFDF